MNKKPLPVCPKCGYQATDPDDPLISGPSNLRECPFCGIIVARYLQMKRDVSHQNILDPDQVSHPLTTASSSTKTKVGKAVTVLTVIVLMIYAGVQWNRWSSDPTGDSAGFKPVPWLVGAGSAEVVIIGPT